MAFYFHIFPHIIEQLAVILNFLLACDKRGKTGTLPALLTGTAATVLELIWSALFQSPASTYMRFLLFCDITQPIVVIP